MGIFRLTGHALRRSRSRRTSGSGSRRCTPRPGRRGRPELRRRSHTFKLECRRDHEAGHARRMGVRTPRRRTGRRDPGWPVGRDVLQISPEHRAAHPRQIIECLRQVAALPVADLTLAERPTSRAWGLRRWRTSVCHRPAVPPTFGRLPTWLGEQTIPVPKIVFACPDTPSFRGQRRSSASGRSSRIIGWAGRCESARSCSSAYGELCRGCPAAGRGSGRCPS